MRDQMTDYFSPLKVFVKKRDFKSFSLLFLHVKLGILNFWVIWALGFYEGVILRFVDCILSSRYCLCIYGGDPTSWYKVLFEERAVS